MITFIVLWFLIGIFGLVASFFVISGSLLVRELIFSVIFSFLGPISIVIFVFMFLIYGDNKWLGKKLL